MRGKIIHIKMPTIVVSPTNDKANSLLAKLDKINADAIKRLEEFMNENGIIEKYRKELEEKKK